VIDALHELPARRPDPPVGPYVVAGLARAGIAATRALLRRTGPDELRVWDKLRRPDTVEARRRLGESGVTVKLGGDGASLLEIQPAPRCVVKSPGIPFEVPLLSEATQRV
jgi:UDP-N-acetylmuramoylalanine-D-glutamate ligase